MKTTAFLWFTGAKAPEMTLPNFTETYKAWTKI